MDLAQTLLRSVARAFYETEYILVIDALILHSALRDDDLALLMGQQTKQLRRLCGKLREDGLISVHSRTEIREGAQRPVSRDYYFINFHRAVDVVKYRLKKMTREIERKYGQTVEEKKEYTCPQCKSQYTLMEVLDGFAPQGFLCRRCGHVLSMAEDGGKTSAGHEVQSRLNAQLAAFEDLMRQIDSTTIPENDFDDALANALPVLRDSSVNPALKTESIFRPHLPAATVHGLKTDPENIEISLLDNLEELDHAAEAARRANIVAQNKLPAWHAVSTVTGDQTQSGAQGSQRNTNGLTKPVGLKTEEEEKIKVDGQGENSMLDAYFAALKEEQEKEVAIEAAETAKEDADEDGVTEEDEDDGEFEDVAVGVNHRKENGHEPPPAKRVRIEEPALMTPALQSTAPNTNGVAEKDVEDSDEDEFEDAL